VLVPAAVASSGKLSWGLAYRGGAGFFSAPFFIWFFLLTDSSTSGKTKVCSINERKQEHV